MEDIKIEGTPKTPTIDFDQSAGKIELSGRSIPENSIEFYKPLLDWIEGYGAAVQANTEVNIKLEYFNTSSSKCILDVFKKLEGISGTEMTVNWYYEEDDEDMLEAGEDYQAIINIPFKMIEVEEM